MPTKYGTIADDPNRIRELLHNAGRAISDRYDDKTHFVFELLQNAEDACADRVRFELCHDRLELRHNGRPFDEPDVRGVCGIRQGTKAHDLTKIGKFGEGFKSVYAYAARPEIHSGEEHFFIENYFYPRGASAIEPGDPWTTLFLLPFINSDEAFSKIRNRLRTLGAKPLLFLRSISMIEWSIDSGSPGGSYIRKSATCGCAQRVRLVERTPGEPETDDKWLVFERPVQIPGKNEFVRVEVAFHLASDDGAKTDSIIPVSESPLVVFFPTEKDTRLGFLIQGAYRTTPARDNIPRDDAWNRQLVEETATLIADTLPVLRDMGLLTVGLLEAMPIRPQDFPEDGMFRPIFERVREALREHALLPAHGGGCVAAKHAKLAESADLRSLLAPEQLQQLFGADSEWRWLSPEISGDLKSYLATELRVGEITADSLSRRLDEPFMEAQPDDWVAKFYRFLLKRDVWEKGQPLRAKPFIRLEDGRHVAPFNDDGSPNAYLPPSTGKTDYPVVRRSVAADDTALQLLKKLDLSEPDIVDEVIERVLTRYEQGSAGPVPDDQHVADLHNIFSALKTDSQAKRQRLLDRLKGTSFVRATNAATGETIFVEPDRPYVRTPELEIYFAGNSQAWFLAEPANHQVDPQPDWASIGVSGKPRRVQLRDSLSWERKHALRGNSDWTRDIENIDYDLDGLEQFLARFAEGKQSGAKQMALVLWSFLLRHLQESSRYSLFQGRYRWFYYKDRSAPFDATLTERLRASAWLPAAGGLRKPAEVSLADLPDEFDRDEELASSLGMKSDALDVLARQSGVAIEVLQHFKRNPEEWEAYKKWRAQQPQFPVKDSPNPEVRRKRVAEQAKNAKPKQYDAKTRSVRTSDEMQPEVKTYLRELYTNDDGKMVCQACRDEMPFQLDDGSYYFEAVQCVTEENRELRENHLALCPVCAAKYKHANGCSPTQVREAVTQATGLEIPITLAREEVLLRFVEVHLRDLQTILG